MRPDGGGSVGLGYLLIRPLRRMEKVAIVNKILEALTWHVGHLVRRLRMDARMTQAQLAKRAGIPLSALQKLEESGSATLSTLHSVTAELETSAADLLGYIQTLNGKREDSESSLDVAREA